MCLLLKVTNLKSVFMERRVFKVFKPGKKFLRSAFFVGSGTRKDGNFEKDDQFFFDPVSSNSFLSRCGETSLQLSQGALLYGRGCSAGCEDNFDGHEVTASALSGHAGWCEDTFDDSVQTSENSVVARVAACSGRELDATSAAARCGENYCNGHLLEFRNSLLAAESGYSLHCLNSLNSLICHPSMQAPSLASGLFVENDGVVGVERFRGSHSGDARWSGTARVGGLQHAGIQTVSACLNSLIREHTECHGSSCSQMGSSCDSRLVRGPGLRGGTKVQVRQGAGERPAFAQQLSGRVHVGTWAGGNKSLNLKISQGKEIMARCAVSGSSPRTPFVTPVLPGPGSDIRMKMGWKVLDKTRKSGVGFSGMWRGCWVVRCGRCSWVRLIGYGRDRTTLRGRFQVVPCAPVRMHTGGAQLSGHILESGVGHC